MLPAVNHRCWQNTNDANPKQKPLQVDAEVFRRLTNLYNLPKPGRRWRRSPKHNIIIISISHPAPCPCPRPRAPSPFLLSQAYGRDYRFRPSPSFSSPPPTQKASVDPDAAGARRAPGRDTTKQISPLLHPFPPDDAPSAASEVLPLPKRHRGLQQTCSAPHPFSGCTDGAPTPHADGSASHTPAPSQPPPRKSSAAAFRQLPSFSSIQSNNMVL